MQSHPARHADSDSTRSIARKWGRLAGLALMLVLGAGCGATAVQGTREPPSDPPLPAGSGLRREDVRFACGEVQCTAWLYLPRAELDVLEGGHFDSYGGPGFEHAVAVQSDFLVRTLLGGKPGSAASPE